jgi:nucleoside phosphorylase
MTLSLQAFAVAIHDLTRLNHNEKVVLFLWYLNDIAGQSRVQPSEIARCYRDLSLDEPQNLHQHIRWGEQRKPRIILRDGAGLRLEKGSRDRLWEEYGASIKEQQAKIASAQNQGPGSDVAIIVALKEEFSELHVQIPDWEPVPVTETGGFDYAFKQASADPDRPYRCVVTFVGEMTHTPSAMETQRLLRTWRPESVVNLGIAGSLSEHVTLGDVVVATVVDDYLARGKAVERSDGAGWDFELSGEPYRPSASLAKFASHIPFAHKTVFELLRAQAAHELQGLVGDDVITRMQQEGLLRQQFESHDGHLASGQVVAAAGAFGCWLKERRDRAYQAIEMEAAGVLAAVHRQLDPQRTMVIRGISDFGDERKKELDRIAKGVFRVFAMRNCIRFFSAMAKLGAFPFAE